MLSCVYLLTILFIDVNSICSVILVTCSAIMNFNLLDIFITNIRQFNNIICYVTTIRFFSASIAMVHEHILLLLAWDHLFIFYLLGT